MSQIAVESQINENFILFLIIKLEMMINVQLLGTNAIS